MNVHIRALRSPDSTYVLDQWYVAPILYYQNEYILELMKYMPVTSIGHCFKTHDILAASGARKDDRQKIAVICGRSEHSILVLVMNS